ncbi:hypothetical protein IMG5_153630 [Ichthyophthirius multifiliis]|uniref:adenylate cyclase n=1 Tax=Ichthyophthirius multifiliis TaxID=5932 RepID=G0QZ11_ICHMU|nr:hypothetical protein IMG5_153630 [Ichthyophthirius multifiliis]EGR29546.1 hypothetical protein IMG5_153630 [Ichthyophthirius multifiliis]|eukprot:XP_004030782.1 hypothetical protein IMG5_153630 [Ichthyophthirius multifiliis]
MKLGIHFGYVIAGVIGYHKPQFSLIGDTVNTASRVCSTSEPGNVTISQSAFTKVKNCKDIMFTRRIIEAKGKGNLVTYQIKNDFQRVIEAKKNSNLGQQQILHVYHYQEINQNIVVQHIQNFQKPIKLQTQKLNQLFELEFNSFTKNQNEQYNLYFKDIIFFSNQLKKQDIIEEFFQNQIYESQTRQPIEYQMWFIYQCIKVISFLVVNIKLIKLFIQVMIIKCFLLLCHLIVLIKYKQILQINSLKKTKLLIYSFYIFQQFIFLFETFCIDFSQYKFSSTFQKLDSYFTFVIYSQFYTQYFIEKVIIFLIIILLEIIICLLKAEYYNLIQFLTISISGAVYHLIMHYLIIQFKIKCFNDFRNLDFKKHLYKRFLVNLLPSHLMDQFLLQQNEQQIQLSDVLEKTTLLFADIAGFTKYCSGQDPEKVLHMLQNIFVKFDKQCINHDVYKVYTIGDCYVVMGTINAKKRQYEVEAKNVINMAFSMIKIIQIAQKEGFPDIDMRIGIHTGNVIGGVIGTDIVRYDIYGADVLIANKMESNGEKGKVMISEATYQLVYESFENIYQFIERKEKVEIKAPLDRFSECFF